MEKMYFFEQNWHQACSVTPLDWIEVTRVITIEVSENIQDVLINWDLEIAKELIACILN